MRTAFFACLVSLAAAAAAAQSHTIVALSHTDHTAYEVDPASGKILNKFMAADQPHEGVASADGQTFYAAIPNGPHVVILDAATFKEKGRIDSEYFHSSSRTARPHHMGSRSPTMAASSMSASKTPTSRQSSSTTPKPTRC